MATLTVEAKGRITLTQELLQHLKLTPGRKVVIEKLPDGQLMIEATPKAGSIAKPAVLLRKREHRG